MDAKPAWPPLARISIGILLFALAAAALSIFSQKTAAPEATFRTLTGESIRISELRGKVLLVNFWATRCAVCIKEMPQIAETHRKFARRGFETIAVAMSHDPANHVIAYAEQAALPFRVALDPQGEVAAGFGGVHLTPTTFLIDKRGRIARQYVGQPDLAGLHALVDELLKEAA